MLAALDAAEAEGGDIRGRQSAALLVVKGASSGRPWADRRSTCASRTTPDPLAELRRLVGVQRAYNHMNAGDDCVAIKDWACAEREYGAAQAHAARRTRRWRSGTGWRSPATAASSRRGRCSRKAFAADARWRELVKRLPAVDQLPKDPKLLEEILAIR